MPSEKVYPLRRSVTFDFGLPLNQVKLPVPVPSLVDNEVRLQMFWKIPAIKRNISETEKIIDEIKNEIEKKELQKDNDSCCLVM